MQCVSGINRLPPAKLVYAGRPEARLSVLDDVWSYCERTGILGRTVTVKIKYADFQIVTRSRNRYMRTLRRRLLASGSR